MHARVRDVVGSVTVKHASFTPHPYYFVETHHLWHEAQACSFARGSPWERKMN